MSQFSPLQIETGNQGSRLARNNGAGGGLAGPGITEGVQTARVLAPRPVVQSDGVMMANHLMNALGLSANLVKTGLDAETQQLNDQTQILRMDVHALNTQHDKQKLADHAVMLAGVEQATKEVPDLQNQASLGKLAPAEGQTYDQFINKLVEDRIGLPPAQGGEGDAKDYELRRKGMYDALAKGLDGPVNAYRLQQVGLAKIDNVQAGRDAVANARGENAAGDIEQSVFLLMATNGISESAAKRELLLPALQAAAAQGEAGSEQYNRISTLLGDEFAQDRQVIAAHREHALSTEKAAAVSAWSNNVTGYINDLTLGLPGATIAGGLAVVNEGRKMGVPESSIKPLIEQMHSMAEKQAKELENQSKIAMHNSAVTMAHANIAAAINAGAVQELPKNIPLVDPYGRPVTDDYGMTKTISRDEAVNQIVDAKVQGIFKERGLTPDQKVERVVSMLDSSGQRYDKWQGLLQNGFRIDPATIDADMKAIGAGGESSGAASNFFQAYDVFSKMPESLAMRHMPKEQYDTYRQVQLQMLNSADALPDTNPKSRLLAAYRSVMAEKADGKTVAVLDPTKLDLAAAEVANTNFQFLGIGSPDATNVGQLREAIRKKAMSFQPGLNGPDKATAMAVESVKKSHRMVGPYFSDVLDANIGRGDSTADDNAEFLKILAFKRAKSLIEANPGVSKDASAYFLSQDKGGWRLYRNSDSGMIPLQVSDRLGFVSYSDMQEVLGKSSVAQYNAVNRGVLQVGNGISSVDLRGLIR